MAFKTLSILFFIVFISIHEISGRTVRVPQTNHTRVKRGDKTCNLSGVCGENDRGVVPCVVDNEPHKFEGSDKVLAILKDECPELFPPGVTIPDVCCSVEDVNKMQGIMKLISSQITNCPDCLQNSKELLCHFHCAPSQKDFLEIVKQTGNAVDEINYYVNEDSINQLFASCEKLPMMQVFLKTAGCKNDVCNVNDFVKIMGSKDIQSPFQMNVIITKDKTVTLGGRTGKPAEFMVRSGGTCN